MPNWGSASWMNSPPLFPAAVGASGPVLALISPQDGAINVPLSVPVRVAVYASAGIASATLACTVNGAAPAPPGIVGPTTAFAGRTFYEAALPATTPPGALIRVTFTVTDTLARTASAVWSYTLAEESGAYTGNGVIPAENWALQPMQIYLELEPLRQALLAAALRDTAGTVTNRNNVAVRVLYQNAMRSDISTTLNPFTKPNAVALASSIPTRASAFELAQVVDAYKQRIDAGLAQLFESGAYPREFRNNFADYLGSLLYSQRVGAACTLVFLGRAVEVAALTPQVHTMPDGATDLDDLASTLAANLGG